MKFVKKLPGTYVASRAQGAKFKGYGELYRKTQSSSTWLKEKRTLRLADLNPGEAIWKQSKGVRECRDKTGLE